LKPVVADGEILPRYVAAIDEASHVTNDQVSRKIIRKLDRGTFKRDPPACLEGPAVDPLRSGIE
jgi:hypothetical protein